MANSKYEYVKTFESHTKLLPQSWIVIRIDGRSFHAFTARQNFAKPNDTRGIALMNTAARAVMAELPDITCAYGVSDEYSFVFGRATELFERREAKLVSTVVSLFTASYVLLWPLHFPGQTLDATTSLLPTFDGRAVVYPSRRVLRDYLSWRQADCHVNNLYNTTFWGLVLTEGKTETQATEELKGTFAKDKHEILFSRLGINYNNEPDVFRKGSFLYREVADDEAPATIATTKKLAGLDVVVEQKNKKKAKAKSKGRITLCHVDIIKDDFWEKRDYILK